MAKLSFIAILIQFSFNGYAQLFNDISSIVGIPHSGVDSIRMMAGVGVLDYDNDGDDDLLIWSSETPILLYRNDGDFKFVDVTNEAGLNIDYDVCTISSADLDNDGWPDLIMGTVDGQPNLIFKNNKDGTFTDVSEQSGVTSNKYWSWAVTIGDFNNDSYLDFYIGNYSEKRLRGLTATPPTPNELFLSQGEAFNYQEQATELSVAGLGYSLAVKFVDFDQDGDLDIYVGNDFGSNGFEINQYYENNGGVMIERGADYGLDLTMFAMGIAYGDYDNDQDFDMYLSDIGNNQFLQNNENFFTDIAQTSFATGNLVSWGAQFADMTNDGLLDIIMTNGGLLELSEDEPLLFYENLGGKFLEYQISIVEYPFFARGMAISDFDNDGDLDLIVNVVTELDTLPSNGIIMLENSAESRFKNNRYLQVQLESVSGNRDGLGSLVKVKLSNGTILSRILDVGGEYLSVHTKTLHFGLGVNTVDEITVTWPQSNEVTTHLNPPVNSLIRIKEGEDALHILRSEVITSADAGLSDQPITLYPSIVKDRLFLRSEITSPFSKIDLQIFTVSGKKVVSHELVNIKHQEIPLSLASGLYIVHVYLNGNYLSQRIIVE